jgi:hypothetical protein
MGHKRYGGRAVKEFRRFLEHFPDWRAVLTKRNHWRLVHRSGAVIGTHSDWRSLHNAAARMRRASGKD